MPPQHVGMSSETPRHLSNLIRLGAIAAVDLAAARVRVATGQLTTDWIPWVVHRAGTTVAWSAPSVGEQVLVLCPEGDPAGAVALCGLYSDAIPAPSSSAAQTVLVFHDGAILRYDADAHALDAVLPGGGKVNVTADGGITLNGPLTVNGQTQINGDTTIQGKATASTDVVGGGISLKGHKHSGVQSGGALTGAAQ